MEMKSIGCDVARIPFFFSLQKVVYSVDTAIVDCETYIRPENFERIAFGYGFGLSEAFHSKSKLC